MRTTLAGFLALIATVTPDIGYAQYAPHPVQFVVELKADAPAVSAHALRRLGSTPGALASLLASPSSVEPLFSVRPPTSQSDDRADWSAEERKRSRWVVLEFPGSVNAENIRTRLEQSAIFESVGRIDKIGFKYDALIQEPLNYCSTIDTGCAGNDPSRYQWWTNPIKLQYSLDYGNGRVLLGAVESGTDTTNTDLRPGLRFQFLGKL